MAKYFFFDTDIVKLLSLKEESSGGAAVQSLVWVQGLAALGNHISIATWSRKKKSLKKEYEHLELVSLYNPIKGLRWIRWAYYRYPSIYKALKKANPDYLYESIPSWGSFFMGIICMQLKIKYIIRLSSDNILSDNLSKRSSAIERMFMKAGLKLSDVILCQNNLQYSQVKKHFPNKRTLKIHNPIVLSGMEYGEKEAERSYIAWVANFRYVKNLKLLYEIALLLKDEKFKIAGVYSNKEDRETTTYLANLTLLDNVTFEGYLPRNKVLEFLSQAKYLLNTSRHEGFSNTFLEALAVGTPVLTTSNANPDDIIDKNKVGLIYIDSFDLKKKLDRMTGGAYKRLSENAVQYVKSHHDHIMLSQKLDCFLKKDALDSQGLNAQEDTERLQILHKQDN